MSDELNAARHLETMRRLHAMSTPEALASMRAEGERERAEQAARRRDLEQARLLAKGRC